MTIFSELVEAHSEAGDDQAVAASILASLKVNKTASEVLLHAVTAAVTFERRSQAAVVERYAFAGKAKGRDLRERLAEGTFSIGNGVRIPWLDATVDDHEARIAYQQRLIGAVLGDIDRHTLAIKLIRDHGVSCLREVPDTGFDGLAA
jgi:hypothetical protein